MTSTRDIAEQLQTNLQALKDTTQAATPVLFQDVIIAPPPDPNREKITLFEKEVAYVTFGGGDEFEYEYQPTYEQYKIPASVTIYLPGAKEVAHPRGMDIADMFLDMLEDDNDISGKCSGIYVNEFIQGSLDSESVYIEILQFMLTIQR